VARQADQAVNFGRLDWHRGSASRVVLEYNRARWNSPAGARSEAVVDRAVASLGSSYGKVDAGVARWVQFVNRSLSNELRVQYGRQLQYESPQTPLAQEPNIGPGGMPPEVSIGPQGLVFGTPSALGQKAYPDERRFEVADLMGWLRGRHFLQFGADFSALRDYTDSLTNAEGTYSYDSSTTTLTGGQVTPVELGGLVDWITDYTYNVNTYPNGGCPNGPNPRSRPRPSHRRNTSSASVPTRRASASQALSSTPRIGQASFRTTGVQHNGSPSTRACATSTSSSRFPSSPTPRWI